MNDKELIQEQVENLSPLAKYIIGKLLRRGDTYRARALVMAHENIGKRAILRQSQELAKLAEELVDDKAELRKMLTAAESERDELRALVEKVEWIKVKSHSISYWVCPWCNRTTVYGHDFDCPRQRALGGGEA